MKETKTKCDICHDSIAEFCCENADCATPSCCAGCFGSNYCDNCVNLED